MEKEIGGWGCEFFVKKTPRTGKSISIALALRACVRAKLRERGVSSVARVGRTDLWGGEGGSTRPFGISKSTFSAANRFVMLPKDWQSVYRRRPGWAA